METIFVDLLLIIGCCFYNQQCVARVRGNGANRVIDRFSIDAIDQSDKILLRDEQYLRGILERPLLQSGVSSYYLLFIKFIYIDFNCLFSLQDQLCCVPRDVQAPVTSYAINSDSIRAQCNFPSCTEVCTHDKTSQFRNDYTNYKYYSKAHKITLCSLKQPEISLAVAPKRVLTYVSPLIV
jgi:hypothetical protein